MSWWRWRKHSSRALVNTKTSFGRIWSDAQRKRTANEEDIIDVDAVDWRLGSAWKRTEDVLDTWGGKIKTGRTPNKTRKSWTWSSSIIQNNASFSSQTLIISVKVRVKKLYGNIEVLFKCALPQNISAHLPTRYEQIEALPEPFIKRQRKTTSSIHEIFRAIAPVPAFNSVVLNIDRSTLPTQPQRIGFGENENRPLLHLAHPLKSLSRNHHINTCHCYVEIWGTVWKLLGGALSNWSYYSYRKLPTDWLAGPNCAFNGFLQEHPGLCSRALLYHPVVLRRYLQPKCFQRCHATIRPIRISSLVGRAHIDFFRTVWTTLERFWALNEGEEAEWKVISNLATQAVHEDYFRGTICR